MSPRALRHSPETISDLSCENHSILIEMTHKSGCHYNVFSRCFSSPKSGDLIVLISICVRCVLAKLIVNNCVQLLYYSAMEIVLFLSLLRCRINILYLPLYFDVKFTLFSFNCLWNNSLFLTVTIIFPFVLISIIKE